MAPTKGDEPPLLEVGTEVSAKFQGAFCEAKIRAVAIDLRVKVRDPVSSEQWTFKHPVIVTDLKDLRLQGKVLIRRDESTAPPLEATVLQIIDMSTYTVVFNDGDIKTIKRTNLLLKSGKHFDQSISLDNLPLTQPEKIGTASGSADAPDDAASKRKTRNPSVASGATDDSDRESSVVRRSVRSKKATTEAPKSGRTRRTRLTKISEDAETAAVEAATPEEAPETVQETKKTRAGRRPPTKRQISREPSEVQEMPNPTETTRKDGDLVDPPAATRRKTASAKPEDETAELPSSSRRKVSTSKPEEKTGDSTTSTRRKPSTGKPEEDTTRRKDAPVDLPEKSVAKPEPLETRRKPEEMADSMLPTRKKPVKPEEKDVVDPPTSSTRKPGKEPDAVLEVPISSTRHKASSPAPKAPSIAKEIIEVPQPVVDYPMGSVVCVHQTGRRKVKWCPALVIHPEYRKKLKVDKKTELFLRLFHNSAFQKVKKIQVKPYSEALYTAPEEERLLKLDPDVALQYFKDKTLPSDWQQSIFTQFGESDEQEEGGADGDPGRQSREDSEDESEATRFMIHWMRYREDSGHQDVTSPTLQGQTVDMYKLYRTVLNVGGFNKCNQEEKWDDLCDELELPVDGVALQGIYKKYLYGGFEGFFRTLATSITDIRLGRKRHQYTTEGAASTSAVEPDRRVQSPPPKRTRAASSPVPALKRGRGRPQVRPKPAASVVVVPPVAAAAVTIKEETPELEEKPARQVSVTSTATTSKRDFSEEGSVKSPAGSEDEWAVIRRREAPNVPPIPNPSVVRPGAVVEILYRSQKGPNKVQPYYARILDNVGDVAFYVHYNNWNKRYDEWKPLSAILKVVDFLEVGCKQYVPTAIMQQKTRSKLKGKQWAALRPQLDRALALEEAAAAAASVTAPEELAKEDPDKPSTSSASQEPAKARKRSPSKSEAAKTIEEPLTLPTAQPEPSPEPKAILPAIHEPEPESTLPAVIPTQKSPEASTSESSSHTEEQKEENTEEISKTSPVAAVEPKTVPTPKIKPSMLIKVETVPRKPTKEDKPSSRKKRSSGQAATVEKTITPKRMLRMAKFLPDQVAKKKPTVVMVPPIPIGATSPSETKKEGSLDSVSSDGKEKNVSEKSEKWKSQSADDEPPQLRSKPGPRKRRPSTTESSKSSQNETEAETIAPEATTSKPASKTKKAKPEAVKPTVSSPEPDSVEIPMKLPNPPMHIAETTEKPTLLKPGRKRHISEPAPVVVEVPVPETAVKADPVPPMSPPVSGPVLLPILRLSEDRDTVQGPIRLINGEKVQIVTPVKQMRIDLKPPELPAPHPPKVAKWRKSRLPRDSEQVVEVALRATAFALEHKAALERLGLPLDGSESSKESMIKEDEYGNVEQLIIEGVDLTDPDLLPGPHLTGTARIEAFEKNLNDSLLVMQLMIHRLATGYHVLKRCESIRQDSRDDRRNSDRKSGVKRTESGPSDSDDEKASTSVPRAKNARIK